MNPYDALANPLRPTFQPDFRTSDKLNRDSELNLTLSRAAYRLVDSVDRLFSRR